MSAINPAQTDTTTPITAPLHLEFDGSLRRPADHDDPSAAIGYRLTDTSGAVIAEESERLAYWRSNTHIEYDALIAALKHADSLAYTGHIIVHGDAESVLEVIDHDEPATARDRFTQRYAEKARGLLDRFDSHHLSSCPRDHNERADELAANGHANDPVPL